MGIWNQLSARTLFGTAKASASEVNAQEKDIHIEEKNRALLTDTVLINKSLMRDGLPIPGSGQIVTTNVTDNTITSLFPDIEAGEVWAVNMIGGKKNGGSGDVVYNMYVTDGTTEFPWFYYKSSDSGIIFTGDANFMDFNMYLDENITLAAKAEGSGGGTYTSVDFYLTVYRVR